MHSLTDIQQEIRPICQRVEKFRLEQLAAYKKAFYYNFIPLGIAGLLLVVWLVTAVGSGTALIPIFGIIVCLIVALVVYFVIRHKYRKAYKSEFKHKIMKTFVEMLYPNMQYEAERFMEERLFKESELFGSHNRYSGEDYFSGTIGNLKVAFSEIDAYYQHSNKNSSTATILDGLFFLLETPNRAHGKVIIIPDSAGNTFGEVGKWVQKNLGAYIQSKKMIYFDEHPEFEKQFVVYATEEEEARQVLTPSLLRTICELRNKWDNNIYIGFQDHKIYMGLPLKKNLFESDINQSLLDNKITQTLYNELALCFAAIEGIAEMKKEE